MTTIATRPPRLAPPAAPTPPTALPPGYAVRLDGTIATLTLPNGACCAFDGRVLTAKTYGPPSAARALEAAHAEASRHAEMTLRPPVVGRRGVCGEDGV